MKLVILESPYAGNIKTNVKYARRCVRDSLSRGEAPIASHLLYTQSGILNDSIPEERQWGIDAGLAWRKVAEGSVIYMDKGVSRGMWYGIRAAQDQGLPIEFRYIDKQRFAFPTKLSLEPGAGVEVVADTGSSLERAWSLIKKSLKQFSGRLRKILP